MDSTAHIGFGLSGLLVGILTLVLPPANPYIFWAGIAAGVAGSASLLISRSLSREPEKGPEKGVE